MLKNNDVRIENDSYKFHLRVAAVIIQNDKCLIQQIEGKDYYVLSGGHVHLGEDSLSALSREVKEEVNCYVKEAKLFCLHENFFTRNGKEEHWIEYYFKVLLKDELSIDNWDVVENDCGEEKLLHFKWITKEELQSIDLKPNAIKELLINNKIDEFNYFIDKN